LKKPKHDHYKNKGFEKILYFTTIKQSAIHTPPFRTTETIDVVARELPKSLHEKRNYRQSIILYVVRIYSASDTTGAKRNLRQIT
jgi:hypothetical protein